MPHSPEKPAPSGTAYASQKACHIHPKNNTVQRTAVAVQCTPMAKPKSVTPPATQSQAVRLGGPALVYALAQAKANKMTLRGTVETLITIAHGAATGDQAERRAAAKAKRATEKGAAK